MKLNLNIEKDFSSPFVKKLIFEVSNQRIFILNLKKLRCNPKSP